MDLVRLTRSLLRDAIKIFMAAQKQLPVHNSRRSIEFLIQPVRRQLFQLVGLLDDNGHAVAADQINAATRADWGGKYARNSILSADLNVHGWSRTSELSPLGTQRWLPH